MKVVLQTVDPCPLRPMVELRLAPVLHSVPRPCTCVTRATRCREPVHELALLLVFGLVHHLPVSSKVGGLLNAYIHEDVTGHILDC